MKKKQYTAPATEQVNLLLEQLMIIASPGVGGSYDPGLGIDSKENSFFDEEEEEPASVIGYEKYSAWED